MRGSHVPILEFWNPPPNISRTVEARYFKFGMEKEAVSSNEKNAKLCQYVSCGSHVSQF